MRVQKAYGICLIALVLWAYPAMAQPAPIREGRYQIVINSAARVDTFLLDTATGKVWQLLQGSTGDRIWVNMTKLDTDQEFMAYMSRQPQAK